MSARQVPLILGILAAVVWSPPAMAQEVSPAGGGATGDPASGTPAALPIPLAPAAPLAPGVPAPVVPVPAAPVRRELSYVPPEVTVPAGSVACPPAVACADRPAPPFVPFMLGDFTGPVANLFTELKVAEGESPRPTDRVFSKFNYYNNVNKARWADPTEPIHGVDLYRYTFGLEKTFFNQSVSLGLRVPFYTLDAEAKDVHLEPDPATGALVQVPGGPGFTTTHFGNISAIVKAVLWEDREAGSLLSGGAVLSFPTAASEKLDPGPSILAYAQPFAGFILTGGDLFVQGFSSMTLPVARPESIVLFTDLGVGYFVHRDNSGSALLTGIAPTLEVHVANPLRDADRLADLFGRVDDLKVHNVVDVTLGTTVEFSHRRTLGLGLVVPLTGPKPFDLEVLAQTNIRF
jgi:hypothetical protein